MSVESAAQGQKGAAKGPLAGITVIDMTRVVAGPFAAQMLADLGADVIKIERRGKGEDLRSLGPPWVKNETGEDTEQSTYFQTVNRNKRSVTLDFQTQEGADILRKLAAKADVLLENLRTGTLDKYGLGYEQLSKINPGLIYCSITGFGQNGPYSDRSGYDYLAQAMGGGMMITGHADGEPGAGPMRVGVPIVDICAGYNSTIGILAALQHRDKTGEGQHVDIALLDSQIGILLNSFSSWLNSGQVLPRTGNDHPTAMPNGVFPVKDGQVLIATFNDREFAKLAEVLGHSEWGQDPRFMRSRDRHENRTVLAKLMAEALSHGTKREWMQRLNDAKVSCGPINTMADLEQDPQVAARNMIVELHHPVSGKVRVAGTPIHLSKTPAHIDRAPPLPGEHTAEVLHDVLGLSQAELDDLARREVI